MAPPSDIDALESHLDAAATPGADAAPAHDELTPPPFAGADLRGARLAGRDLSGLDLSDADLSGADLSAATLVGTILHGARLDGAKLLAVDLSGADLAMASATRASFGGATAQGAAFAGADLTDASMTLTDLTDADLRGARCHGVRLREADLTGADLHAADLSGSDLDLAVVRHASFREANLSGIRLRGLTDADTADWVGTTIVDIDFNGAYLTRRVMLDQNYLHEFRSQSRRHEVLYRVWKLTSDCGRSFGRWALLTVALAALFAVAYLAVDIDYGDHRTALSPIYYSLVTMTTLGYGDVLPASGPAQVVAMAEVVTGYFMLGGLLGIFASKMSRRAD